MKCLLFGVLCLSSLQIQLYSASLDGLSDVGLVSRLQSKISEGPIAVRPILEELVSRTEGKPDQEPFLFLLGLSYQDGYAEDSEIPLLEKAEEYYQKYVQRFPDGEHIDIVRFN